MEYPYRSLEDFLIANPLTVDGQLNDGWGAFFPVKGREITATVLFADITSFSSRTVDLSPAETLIFVNNFFAWITAEALRGGNGIVDKYIGDEMMIVFSKEFGSEDPFVEAVQTARWMAENDALDFCPHMGLASGLVIVGYVGTPLKYSASVFGAPVALASRCVGIKPEAKDGEMVSSSIVFPALEWKDRDFDEVIERQLIRIPPELRLDGENEIEEREHFWQLRSPRMVSMKNLGEIEIQEIVNRGMRIVGPVEDRAREALAALRRAGHYRPPDELT